MEFCVGNETMRISDQLTIDGGTSGVELMRRVAEKTLEAARRAYGKLSDKRIYIICGKGNNGGDGYALARLMSDSGIGCSVFYVEPPSSADAEFYAESVRALSHSISQCDFTCDIIFDCIFGTGFYGRPTGIYSEAIASVNAGGAYVVSVDVPSGLCGDNGLATEAVKADLTIAVQSKKYGHVLADGKDFCGAIEVADVGIEIVGQRAEIIDDDFVAGLFPPRRANANKGTFGLALVIGGSNEYSGAPRLSAMGVAALRGGAGLCRLAMPTSLTKRLAAADCTTFGLAEDDGRIVFEEDNLRAACVGAKAIAVGMGMGGDIVQNLAVIRYVTALEGVRVVIDADALNALASDKTVAREIFEGAKADILVTPHPKEMARLSGLELGAVLSAPHKVASDFARDNGVTVLLKGASTLICSEAREAVVTNGTPALAKGGNGDVLSGAIVGACARGLDVFDAACCGAYLCAEAGRRAAERFGEYGVLASDVAALAAEIVRTSKKV